MLLIDYGCFQLGGPTWTVQLGRRDSTTASFSTANSDLPAPTSDLDALISLFSNKGFTTQEMVVLSGILWHLVAQIIRNLIKIVFFFNIKKWYRTSRVVFISVAKWALYISPLYLLWKVPHNLLYVWVFFYLSGTHTIGKAQCSKFRDRIYNETNIDATFATSKQAICPSSGGDENLSDLDGTTTDFDNVYFTNLIEKKGLLHSDQQLYNGNSTDSMVETYSNDSTTFFTDVASAMVKMGNLSPLTGTDGEIRTNCRAING